MSLNNILVPNNYNLFCNTITTSGIISSGGIVTGDIIYHTLTQDNGNSFVDVSGNAKLGNFTAGVADCVDVVASNSIFAGSGGIDTDGDLHVTGTSFLGAWTSVSDTTTSGTRLTMNNPSGSYIITNISNYSILTGTKPFTGILRNEFTMQNPLAKTQTWVWGNQLRIDEVAGQYFHNIYLDNETTPSGQLNITADTTGSRRFNIENRIDQSRVEYELWELRNEPTFSFKNKSGNTVLDFNSFIVGAVSGQPILTTCDIRSMRNRNSVYANVTGSASVILKNSDYVISASGNNLFDTTYVLTGSAAILTLPTHASLVTLYSNLGLSGTYTFSPAPNRIPYAQDYFKFNVVNTLGTPVTISDSTDGKVVMGSTNQIDASSGVRSIYCFFQGISGASGTATPSVICY